MLALQATAAVPAHSDFPKIVGRVSGVGCFLVVVEMVASTGVAGEDGQIDSECPAGDVERVHSIVGEFAAAVEPVPMPVVMD